MTAYLSLGSNLGDKQTNLQCALDEIEKRIGHICAQSAFLATAPWGFTSDNSFFNACIAVETTLTPRELLERTQAIERALGRQHKSATCGRQDGQLPSYQDRIIDIDILLCGDTIIDEPGLHIPHPLMHERLFVLQPLDEIAHDLVVPGTGKSVGELLATASANV